MVVRPYGQGTQPVKNRLADRYKITSLLSVVVRWVRGGFYKRVWKDPNMAYTCPVCKSTMTMKVIKSGGEEHREFSCENCDHGYITGL